MILRKGITTLKIFNTSGKEDEEGSSQRNSKIMTLIVFLSVGGDGTIKLIAEILKDDSIPYRNISRWFCKRSGRKSQSCHQHVPISYQNSLGR